MYKLSFKQIQNAEMSIVIREINGHRASLRENKPLRIELSGNLFGEEGCLDISKEWWELLQELEISGNSLSSAGKIGDEGTKHLSDARWSHL